MSETTPKRLGIVGFGSFGQFAAEHLSAHFDVVVADLLDHVDRARELGVQWGSVEDATTCPYVILAVPVQNLTEAIESIRPHLNPGTLVIDVGSVKLQPLQQMLELLPEEVEILGTHPMFGPQSAVDGLHGHRIVLCPVRTARADQVQRFLEEQLRLEVIVSDAETHDRDIAQTQALAQFVGRALAALDRSDSAIRTPGYEHLREVAETVGEDSWELFSAIQNINPYAREMRDRLMRHLEDVEQRLAADVPLETTSNTEPATADAPNDRAEAPDPEP